MSAETVRLCELEAERQQREVMRLKPYWSSEQHGLRIYCGDCLEVMPKLEAAGQRFDLCLTDFDYCIDNENVIVRPETDGGSSYATGNFFASEMNGDRDAQRAFCEATLAMIEGLLGQGCVICAFHAVDKLGFVWDWAAQSGMIAVQPYTWVKRNPMPQLHKVKWANGIEQAAIVAKPGKRHHNFAEGHRPNYVVANVGRREEHPTEKPVGVMEPVVRWWSYKDDHVLDPFVGSGTTLVAAYRLGRQATGIEISEEYCELAARRLERELAQGRLFEPAEVAQPRQQPMAL